MAYLEESSKRGDALPRAAACAGSTGTADGNQAVYVGSFAAGQSWIFPISKEYEANWNTEAVADRYELKLQIVSAFDLARPEYRLGDLTSKFFCGQASLLN